ncbi:MAG: mechanosensitive ion channel family protein [Gemmatimonadota bacterium]
MQDVNVLFEPAKAFLVQIGSFMPRLGIAIVILIVGWLLAKALRFAVERGLRAFNLPVLTERAGIDPFLRNGGITTDTVGIFSALAYWLVIFVALLVAFNSLGLDYATDLLRQVVLFLPKVFVALLVIAFGAYFARFIGDAVRSYMANIGVSDADLLARIAQYSIVVFVILIAIDELNMGGALVQTTFLILLSGVVLALALAFGIGGRDWAAALLERWWPRERRPHGETARPPDRP